MDTPRKRVLFVVPSFSGGAGGAERVMSTLLHNMDYEKFECHVALVQAKHAYFADLGESVAVHHLNVSRMRYALPAVVRLVRRIRPQTVLSTVSFMNVTMMMARPLLPSGTRVVLREATTPSAFVANDVEHPWLWKRLYRHLYQRADKIVCLSNSMFQDLTENFAIPAEKLVRICNPVDFSRIQTMVGDAVGPFVGPGPHLVVAGRLRKEKGVDVLLDAMPAVVRHFPHARLTILGEGPQEGELRSQAAKLNLIEHLDFLGFQDNPFPWLAHADLLVLPSRFEGMPNSVLEALALGTPVVASDCVGALREIQESTNDLVLVLPENPDALAEGIVQALALKKARRNPSDEALPLLQKFDARHVALEYSRLF